MEKIKSKLSNTINKFLKWFDFTEKINVVDMIFAIFIVLFVLTNYMYGDIFATVEHSFNLLDCIKNGEIGNFYQYAIEHSSYGHPAVYDILIYVVFAIWNLPIYIIKSSLTGSYMDVFLCRIWIKLMLLVFVCFSAVAVKRICEEMGVNKNRAKWASLLFVTSTTMVTSTLMIAQYDIICVTFMLWGILAYIQNDNKKFILLFCLANTFKLFGIFVFVPLVLLRNKKILVCIRDMIFGLLGVAICKLAFLSDVAYTASTKTFSSDMLGRLQVTGFRWNYDGYVVSIFLLVYFAVCIFCYAKECDDKSKFYYKNLAVYIPLIVFGIFVASVPLNPYWITLLAPFMVLVAFVSPKHFKLNILLETAIGLGLCFIVSYFNSWVYGAIDVEGMLADKIFDVKYVNKFQNISEIYHAYGLSNYLQIVVALVCACIFAMLYINFPKEDVECPNSDKIERSVIWFRFVTVLIVPLLILYCYFSRESETIYTSQQDEPFYLESDILQGNVVSEHINVDRDCNLQSIAFEVSNCAFSWIDTSVINVELLKDDKLLFEKQIAANTLTSFVVNVDCGNMYIEDGHYEIRLSGYGSEGSVMYVKMTNTNNNETFQNGTLIDGDVAFSLYGTYK